MRKALVAPSIHQLLLSSLLHANTGRAFLVLILDYFVYHQNGAPPHLYCYAPAGLFNGLREGMISCLEAQNLDVRTNQCLSKVFMTRRDVLESVHEPFGDAFYYGPERLSERYRDDATAREASGCSGKTYKNIVDVIEDAGKEVRCFLFLNFPLSLSFLRYFNHRFASKEDYYNAKHALHTYTSQGKRVFIKDMAYYLFAPDGKPTKIAPSFGVGEEPGNPTVMPLELLKKFNFTFLIRHPRRAIPSYFRCTVPPLDEATGFYHFMPNEAGYDELVRLFDFLIEQGIVDKKQLVVVDADDMLDNPEKTIRYYCERTGIDFTPEMLNWNQDDKKYAADAFEKWKGFHNDAIGSDSLRARTHKQVGLL